jgi:hypothetical protein
MFFATASLGGNSFINSHKTSFDLLAILEDVASGKSMG